MPSIRTRMRVLLAEREWSQAKIAEKVGASRAFINAIEKGRYQPGLRLAFKIARAFGKPIEEVFVSGPLYAPRGHLQPSPSLVYEGPGHLSLAGLRSQ